MATIFTASNISRAFIAASTPTDLSGRQAKGSAAFVTIRGHKITCFLKRFVLCHLAISSL